MKIFKFLKTNKLVVYLLGLALGALAGYIYYKTVGCITGTCPITSNPVKSSLYGGLIGFLVANIFV